MIMYSYIVSSIVIYVILLIITTWVTIEFQIKHSTVAVMGMLAAMSILLSHLFVQVMIVPLT